MITINKAQTQSIIILDAVGEGKQTLALHSEYTLEDYHLDLGNNNTSYKSRYSWFILDLSNYTSIPVGLYHYQHKVNGVVATFGILKVSDDNALPVTNILEIQDDDDDRYLVFKG